CGLAALARRASAFRALSLTLRACLRCFDVTSTVPMVRIPSSRRSASEKDLNPYCVLGMAVLRRRNCQIFGPNRHLAKFPDGPCRYFDVRVHFNPHSIWQATERKLERGDAFGFVSHKGSPAMLNGEKSLHPSDADGERMTDPFRERSSFSEATV